MPVGRGFCSECGDYGVMYHWLVRVLCQRIRQRTLWRQALVAKYNDSMTLKKQSLPDPQAKHWYHGADVPKHLIRAYARRIAERFQPDKIILFGSYAYGTPHADSDVDILVIMPARNELDQAFKIRWQVPAPFPMDLLVRTPKNIEWRLKDGDLFHTKIVTKGKLLYEKKHARMGKQSRSRFPGGSKTRAR